MAKLGGQGETQQFKEFQSLLDETKGCLGLDRKVQTEDVRRGLVQRVQSDLAKDFVLWRQGRRAVPNPHAAGLPQQVLQALRKPLPESSGGDVSMGSASEGVGFDEESGGWGFEYVKVLWDFKDILRMLRADLGSLFAQKVNQSTMTILGEATEGGTFPKESTGAAKEEQASDQDDGLFTEDPDVRSFINNAVSTVDLEQLQPPEVTLQTGVKLEVAQKESAGVVDESDQKEATFPTEASEVGDLNAKFAATPKQDAETFGGRNLGTAIPTIECLLK
ncbi:unnamed protein product, partial [Prorocentrum cordatum]